MDKDFIYQTVLTASQEVFSTMLGMEAEAGENLADAAPTESSERVVALIGLAGSHVGSGMIGCSPRLACKMASNMMMAEYSVVDGDVLDAMGEISNMIFGNVKTALEAQVGPLGLSIPTVVFGRNFTTRSLGQQPWVTTPLTVGDEQMDLRFCIAVNSSSLQQAKHAFKREYVLTDVA